MATKSAIDACEEHNTFGPVMYEAYITIDEGIHTIHKYVYEYVLRPYILLLILAPFM